VAGTGKYGLRPPDDDATLLVAEQSVDTAAELTP
jgi:hypothetical protein